GLVRTRPQAMYSQNDWSSSSITQLTASQGNPFLLVSVDTRPSFKRLSPPSVEAQSVPSRSSFRRFTRPAPRPLEVEYEVWILPSWKYATPHKKNPNQKPPPPGTAIKSVGGGLVPSLEQGILSKKNSGIKRKKPKTLFDPQKFPSRFWRKENQGPPEKGLSKINPAVS